MRTCFTRKVSETRIAILDVCPFNEKDGLLITRINVPVEARGRGHASYLLWNCCKAADLHKKTLYLTIMPSGGLSFAQLERFYMRYGFEHWNEIYRRLPNAPIQPFITREHHATR